MDSSHTTTANDIQSAGKTAGLRATLLGLPRAQKCMLTALLLGVLGVFTIPFLQIDRFSMLRGTDNTFYYFWLRSAAVDGDWDFANDLQETNTLTPFHRAEIEKIPLTETGRVANKYGIGWALVSAPFYAIADAVVLVGHATGFGDWPRDGYSAPYQIGVQIGQFLIGFFGLWLAWLCARKLCNDSRAALWAVAFGLAAGPQLYYLTLKLSLSHAAAFTAIALMTHACLAAREEPRRAWPWIIAGAAWALAVLMRFQLAVFALLPAWIWLECFIREKDVRAAVLRAAWLVAGFTPLIVLQLYAWNIVYGSWLVFTYGENGEGFNWTQPEILNVLFSPRHGLLYWHSFLAVGVAGLIALAVRDSFQRVALLCVGLTLYVNAAWWCWWFAGNSFGSRAFEAAMLFFMFGIAFLLARATPRWKNALLCTGAVACAWNFYVMILFYSGAISRDGPVTWLEKIQTGIRLLGSTIN